MRDRLWSGDCQYRIVRGATVPDSFVYLRNNIFIPLQNTRR
jgi:hypothetical protein